MLSEDINRMEARVAKAFERHGLVFVHSTQIGPYEVDFRLGDKIVVEVDGMSHLTVGAGKRDEAKDRYLHDLGFNVLRIPGTAVHTELEQFVERVRAAMKAERARVITDRTPSPFATAGLEQLRDSLAARETAKPKQPLITEPADDTHLFREWVGDDIKPPRSRQK